jgi:hemoglobin
MKEGIITKENIFKLVENFYAKIRQHSELGIIFNDAIKDEWPEHLEKIASFWEGIMLHTGNYSGNPPRAHLNLPKFDLELFKEWLRLFFETADEIFIPKLAESFKDRSQIIADNLKRMLEAKK